MSWPCSPPWHLWTAPAFKLQQLHWGWISVRSGREGHQHWAPTQEAAGPLPPSAPQKCQGRFQQVLCSIMAWTDPVLKSLGSHWVHFSPPVAGTNLPHWIPLKYQHAVLHANYTEGCFFLKQRNNLKTCQCCSWAEIEAAQAMMTWELKGAEECPQARAALGGSAALQSWELSSTRANPRACSAPGGWHLWHWQCCIPGHSPTVCHTALMCHQHSSCTAWWSLIKTKMYRADFSFYKTHCAF